MIQFEPTEVEFEPCDGCDKGSLPPLYPMNVTSLFPSLLHKFDIYEFKDSNIYRDSLNYISQERKKDPKGIDQTNIGGWQSNILGRDNVITNFISREVHDYFFENEIFKSNVGIHLLNAWININKKGDYNTAHVHGDSHLSGCFYIKVPPNSGKIVFYSPHNYPYYVENACYSDEFVQKYYSQSGRKFTPQEGEIFIFPSGLYHSVESNQTRNERISVGFNLALRY